MHKCDKAISPLFCLLKDANGFFYCQRCGRMVSNEDVGTKEDLMKILEGFNLVSKKSIS